MLLEVAPDLVELLVPGGALISKAGVKLGGKLGKAIVGQTSVSSDLKAITSSKNALLEAGKTPLDQEHIFEQCSSFLIKLAAKQPLLIALDDLQWADASSLTLLYHLARRIGGNQILVVGAYRPEELSQGRAGERHPLEKVEAELARLLGEVTIELERADAAQGRWFVDARRQRGQPAGRPATRWRAHRCHPSWSNCCTTCKRAGLSKMSPPVTESPPTGTGCRPYGDAHWSTADCEQRETLAGQRRRAALYRRGGRAASRRHGASVERRAKYAVVGRSRG